MLDKPSEFARTLRAVVETIESGRARVRPGAVAAGVDGARLGVDPKKMSPRVKSTSSRTFACFASIRRSDRVARRFEKTLSRSGL